MPQRETINGGACHTAAGADQGALAAADRGKNSKASEIIGRRRPVYVDLNLFVLFCLLGGVMRFRDFPALLFSPL